MIKREFERYAVNHTSPESGLLQRLYRETHLKTVYPRMISGQLQGKLLEMFSHMAQPARILEIGTFTGYATLCLARGLTENGIIHTVEAEPEMQEIFKKYFVEAGIADKVKIHIGQALDIIPKIKETFDLIFIDADKDNYLNYYKMLLPKLRLSGFLIADNAFWGGKVLKKDKDKETQGIIDFNEFVQMDNRVENVLLTVRDGLMVVRKLRD